MQPADQERPLNGQAKAGDEVKAIAETVAAGEETPRTRGGGEGETRPAGKSALRETLETVLVALLIALVIRSFLVQLYVVDGESMYPTLHDGDRLLVNKIVYRLREPKVGEVVVLEDPQNPSRQLVKRVIAVGGETVEIRNQVTYINGKPVDEPFTNPFSVHFSDLRPVQVPEGEVYVMGDNRGGSHDSRAMGAIPKSKLQGPAFFLFWPIDRFTDHGPLAPDRTYK